MLAMWLVFSYITYYILLYTDTQSPSPNLASDHRHCCAISRCDSRLSEDTIQQSVCAMRWETVRGQSIADEEEICGVDCTTLCSIAAGAAG